MYCGMFILFCLLFKFASTLSYAFVIVIYMDLYIVLVQKYTKSLINKYYSLHLFAYLFHKFWGDK